MRPRTPLTPRQSLVSTVHTSLASPLAATSASHLGSTSHTIRPSGNPRRSPATAGKACTMSPSDPSRTTRNPGSGMRRLADGLQQAAGGMVLGVSDDGHADSQAVGRSALRDVFGGVVGSLGVHLGAQLREQVF